MQKLIGLQYLRAIAATMVLLFHAGLNAGYDVFRHGIAGVDIFFVLSGFLMWEISAETRPLAFLQDRIRRIVPVYWLITILMAIAVAAGLFRQTIVTAPYLLKSLFFIPAISPSKGTVFPLLQPGWTLNYEIFFYVLFALALFGSRAVQLVAITTALIGLVVAGALLAPQDVALHFYTDAIVLEFLLGIYLAIAWKGGPRWPILPILALVVAVDPVRAWFAIPAVIAVAVVLYHEKRLPRWRWLEFLGDASYSIYLWHSLAIAACVRVALFYGFSNMFALIVSAFAGLAAGIAGFLLIERPLLRRNRKAVINLEPARA